MPTGTAGSLGVDESLEVAGSQLPLCFRKSLMDPYSSPYMTHCSSLVVSDYIGAIYQDYISVILKQHKFSELQLLGHSFPGL